MNRPKPAAWMALIVLTGLAACERARAPEPFPQAVADGWVAAFNSGDAAGLALMYSADAQILPPDQPIVTGHDAVEEFFKSFNPGRVRIETSGVETKRLGDYWFREGTYNALYSNEGATRFGKFMELWIKVDNNWLIYRQMWSPNTPQPAEMPPTAPAS